MYRKVLNRSSLLYPIATKKSTFLLQNLNQPVKNIWHNIACAVILIKLNFILFKFIFLTGSFLQTDNILFEEGKCQNAFNIQMFFEYMLLKGLNINCPRDLFD